MNTQKPHTDDDIWSFIRTLITAGIIAIVFRAFLFEPFSIPSGSMVPTLLVGDYLFVAKYSYGYSGLSTGLGFLQKMGIALPKGRFAELHAPQRGDVVVFKLPRDTGTDYVKRLIGLPGDKIQVRSGHLYINDKEVPREKDGVMLISGRDLEADHPKFNSPYSDEGTLYKETLPEGRVHPILEMTDEGLLDNTGVYTVPENSYFMMGDNRDNSSDSRVMRSVGFVPRENLVGRAEFIFFSLHSGTPFWKFWEWPMALQWNRMFKKIS